MHACITCLQKVSPVLADKNLMCCARQFSFIAIVVFTNVKKSAIKSAKIWLL